MDANDILNNASKAKTVAVEGAVSTTAHSIPDQIAADRYAKNVAARAAGRGPGLQFFQFRKQGGHQ